MEQVFISYSHQEQEFVARLTLDLEKRGARVWIDREDIHAGTKWQESIVPHIARIRRSRSVDFCLTEL